jgi:uncharacterized protein (TIGR03083 family)
VTASFATHVDWLEIENLAFADACERDLTASVPTCPGWTVLDLVAHHASYQAWITEVVNERLLAPRAPANLSPPDGVDPIDWYRAVGSALIDSFRSTDGAVHVWGVTNQQTVGAWARRQASETAVHRWDAENATGVAAPIENADDYIGEILDHLVPSLVGGFGAPAPHGTITLHSTDSAHTWTAAADLGTVSPGPESTAADVTITGTASDLVLALWNRPNGVGVVGDAEVLEQWRRAITGG